MKYVNNLSVRVFCKSDDDEKKILVGLKKIIGFSGAELSDEKLCVVESVAKGFDESIKIFEFHAEKDRHVNFVLKNLNSVLSVNDKRFLLTQENRLDDNLDFFLRLSKPLILKNSFELTDSGDCFHIRINVASFPKNKEIARNKLKQIFS